MGRNATKMKVKDQKSRIALLKHMKSGQKKEELLALTFADLVHYTPVEQSTLEYVAETDESEESSSPVRPPRRPAASYSSTTTASRKPVNYFHFSSDEEEEVQEEAKRGVHEESSSP